MPTKLKHNIDGVDYDLDDPAAFEPQVKMALNLFPYYTREQAEEEVRGWIDRQIKLEADIDRKVAAGWKPKVYPSQVVASEYKKIIAIDNELAALAEDNRRETIQLKFEADKAGMEIAELKQWVPKPEKGLMHMAMPKKHRPSELLMMSAEEIASYKQNNANDIQETIRITAINREITEQNIQIAERNREINIKREEIKASIMAQKAIVERSKARMRLLKSSFAIRAQAAEADKSAIAEAMTPHIVEAIKPEHFRPGYKYDRDEAIKYLADQTKVPLAFLKERINAS